MNKPIRTSPAVGITGVVGSNGAGKTHYLRELAQNPQSALGQAAGDMHYFGRSPKQHFSALSTGWTDMDESHAAELLDFPVTTPWRKLSVGQRQMVINAGVFASNKSELLLDEPFNGLDASHRNQLKDLLRTRCEEFPDHKFVVTSQHASDLEGLVDFIIPVRNFTVDEPIDVEMLRLKHPVITAESSQIEAFTSNLTILRKQKLGQTTRVVLAHALTSEQTTSAHEQGLEVTYLNAGELIEIAGENHHPEEQQ